MIDAITSPLFEMLMNQSLLLYGVIFLVASLVVSIINGLVDIAFYTLVIGGVLLSLLGLYTMFF
jgi:hypothetical membrane protein